MKSLLPVLLSALCWGMLTARAALTEDLVVHLPFDGTFADASGRGNHGFPQGEPAFNPGRLAGAVFVNNGGDGSFAHYVSLSDVANAVTGPDLLLGDTTDFTIALWVQLNDFGGDPAFVSNKSWNAGGNPGFVLATESNRRLQWNWVEGGCSRKDYDGTGGTLTLGGWHHLALVAAKRDGTEAALRAYIDGQLVNETAIRSNPCDPGSIDTADLGLSFNIGNDGTGAYIDSGSNHANTGIDDFGLWHRALTTFEISRIHTFGLAGTNLASIPEPTRPSLESSTPAKNSVTASPGTVCEVRFEDAGTTTVPATAKASFDGVAVTPIITKTGDLTTVSYDPPGLLQSLSAHTFTVEIQDNADPANVITEAIPFTVVSYIDVALPAPLYRETFDELEEGTLPAGWEATHLTDGESGFSDLADFRSDAYLNWVVVEASRQSEWTAGGGDYGNLFNVVPDQFVNGQAVTTLLESNFLFAASTDRQGRQIQNVVTHDIPLAGASGIHLLFHSASTQNQDSLFAVEYSVTQGDTWLPALYCLDDEDVVKLDGATDAEATFTQIHDDVPGTLVDADQNPLPATYGDFLLAPIGPDLASFISPRINDNQTESKRVEYLRLAGADGQARVRLRFVNMGSNSWYSAIDNLNLYSLGSAPAETIVLTSVAPVGTDVKLDWTGGRAPFQVQRSTSLASGSWTTVETTANRTVTLVPGAAAVFYRVVSAP